MKHDKYGNKLYKRIHVKMIVGKKTYNHDYRAPAGHFYNYANIEDAQEKMIDYIDKKFPLLEFRLAEIAPNAFNFIAVGNRKKEQDGEERSEPSSRRADGENCNESVRETGAPDRAVATPQ